MSDSESARTDAATPQDGEVGETHGATVWRYRDMCRHWNVSRTTIERWVRRYEEHGEGIPVHRDPSGRPYWLPEEATATAAAKSTVTLPQPPPRRIARSDDERLARLRRAAQRSHRIA